MGPHDDDGSGVTLAVALRAVPVYPATTAATAAATPSANSENFLFNAPSSIVRPDVSVKREEPCLPSCLASEEYFAPQPAFQGGWVTVSGWTGWLSGRLQCAAPAAVAQLVDAMASKAIVLRDVWVRVPPAA